MVARIALTTLFVTVVTWPWFGMSGIVSGVVIWMIYEWAYRMRRRALVVCPHCGFDPFLYMVDLGKARQAVRDFWQKRQPVPPAQDSLTESQVER